MQQGSISSGNDSDSSSDSGRSMFPIEVVGICNRCSSNSGGSNITGDTIGGYITYSVHKKADLQ